MLIYYLIFIIAFALSCLDYSRNKYIKLFTYLFFCGILILLPALRDIGTDNDSTNYNYIFNTTENYSFRDIITGNYDEDIERGYMLLNKIVITAGGSVYTVFFIVAVLSGLLNYTFFLKLSPFPFTSLLFYLSFFYLYRDFTQIRYCLSCALVFGAVYYFLLKKWLKFGLFIISAILFHNTAMIMLLILPFCRFFKSYYSYLVFLVFSIIGLVVNPFPLVLAVAGMPEHMLIYLDESNGGGFMVSLVGCLVILLLVPYKKLFKEFDDLNFYFRLFVIGVALSLLFMQTSIFQRFSYLLFQFGVILLPTMLYQLQKLRDRYYFVALHMGYNCFLLYYGIKMIQPTLIRPYF